MPFEDEGRENGIGVAMSGGGFRATLFHLGSLIRMNEMGLLPQIKRFSSVSGGSITCGHLANTWKNLHFNNSIAYNFSEVVVVPLEEFCGKGIDVSVIGRGVLDPFKRPSDYLVGEYRSQLGLGTPLSEMPDKPRFVFNSTNLATGVTFRFSKPYAGDYRIGLIHNPGFDIATAVAASSAFPPFLSPVVLDVMPDQFSRTDGADLYDRTEFRQHLKLTDGGVYDNLGLETVWNRYETVLVSDAGAPFGFDAGQSEMWASQALRISDISINQCRSLRKRALIGDLLNKKCQGAYWGIGTDYDDYSCENKLTLASREVAMGLAQIRTRLDAFSVSERSRLINWGYALCDAALRTYVREGSSPPSEWPRPKFAL